MNESCQLGTSSQRSAEWHPGSDTVPGQLQIRVSGEHAESCWSAEIHQSPLRIWPPEFYLEVCRTSAICNEVITPFEVVRAFEVGTCPTSITLHEVDGRKEVPVEVVPDLNGLVGRDEVVGVSLGVASLTAALADAAGKLYPGQHPNVPRAVRVIDITYKSGGIVGQSLEVRARKAD